MLDKPFRGFALVLGVKAKFDSAQRLARKLVLERGKTVYIGYLGRDCIVWVHPKGPADRPDESEGKLLDMRDFPRAHEYRYDPVSVQQKKRSR